MDAKKDIVWRVYLMYSSVVLFGIAILFRIFYLQSVQGDYWKQKQEKFTIRTIEIDAIRGNIYSSDGSLIATSVPKYEVRMDLKAESITPEVFKANIDSLAISLSNMFRDKTAYQFKTYLKQAYRKGNRYLLIRRDVSFLDLKKMKTFPIWRMGKNRGGLVIIQKNKRVLPFKELAARTIGYEREAGRFLGLENTYNEQLAGTKGLMLVQKISGGHEKPLSDDSQIEPKDGYDIISTIDINMQDVAEAELMKQLMVSNADHGSVVLMEVKTGKIRAIANLGKDKDGIYKERYNYAVGESTEPGSTFKLASIVAAIEDGFIDIKDTVNTGNGTYQFFNQTMKDSHEGGYGRISLQKSFELSSNVGISKMIFTHYAKTPQKFIDRLHSFNLNTKTGIELDGEGNPRIKTTKTKSWSKVSLPWMSIGYEVSVTPLQTLTFYNAIANNGKMMKPYLIEKIVSNEEIIKEIKPTVIKKSICSQRTIDQVKLCLEGVVQDGTGKNLKSANFKIAGKTGTTQLGYNNKSQSMQYQASFVGYFPADSPLYSCIVVINKPTNGYYGNVIAGPIFKEISNKIYANRIDLQIEEDLEKAKSIPSVKQGNQKDIITVLSSLNVKTTTNNIASKWVITESTDKKVKLGKPNIESELKNKILPNVKGMGAKDAIFLLENAGLIVSVNGRGAVIRQSLLPGTRIFRGTRILLELS